MSTVTPAAVAPLHDSPPLALPLSWSLADLQLHLGNVPLGRIRLYPPPGLATVEDVLREVPGRPTCELIDGVLVEKPMGSFESLLAMILGHLLLDFLDENAHGVVFGEQGSLQILPNQVRVPDVSFIRWDRFPDGKLPDQSIYEVPPDLAVEILSPGNTPGEMNRKLDEYFQSGVRLVWYVNPKTRTARIFTARDQMQEIDENGVLGGGDVLPGFELRLGELFQRATRDSS